MCSGCPVVFRSLAAKKRSMTTTARTWHHPTAARSRASGPRSAGSWGASPGAEKRAMGGLSGSEWSCTWSVTLQSVASQRASTISGESAHRDSQNSFTGYRIDTESGLMYARARMYSAKLGRFISRDFQIYLHEKYGFYPVAQDFNVYQKEGANLYAGYFVPGKTDASGHGCAYQSEFDSWEYNCWWCPWWTKKYTCRYRWKVIAETCGCKEFCVKPMPLTLDVMGTPYGVFLCPEILKTVEYSCTKSG